MQAKIQTEGRRCVESHRHWHTGAPQHTANGRPRRNFLPSEARFCPIFSGQVILANAFSAISKIHLFIANWRISSLISLSERHKNATRCHLLPNYIIYELLFGDWNIRANQKPPSRELKIPFQPAFCVINAIYKIYSRNFLRVFLLTRSAIAINIGRLDRT